MREAPKIRQIRLYGACHPIGGSRSTTGTPTTVCHEHTDSDGGVELCER